MTSFFKKFWRKYEYRDFRLNLGNAKKAEHLGSLQEKFYFHFSILAGGTFTVLIPFVQHLSEVKNLGYVKFASFCLLLSVMASLLVNFFLIYVWRYAALFSKDEGYSKVAKVVILAKEVCLVIALISYPTALIFIYLFIWKNV